MELAEEMGNCARSQDPGVHRVKHALGYYTRGGTVVRRELSEISFLSSYI